MKSDQITNDVSPDGQHDRNKKQEAHDDHNRSPTLSPDPVRRRLGELGENATALTSAECASTCCLGLSVPSSRVSQLREH